MSDPAATVKVTGGNTPEAPTAELARLATEEGVSSGPPVLIEGDASAGATLTKVYGSPLPPDRVAAFAYWDQQLDGWRAVESQLSADRTTLTARVSHFSLWTDIAEAATFQLGNLFDERVDSPTCQGTTPTWVDGDAVFVDDQNAPLRWCTGSDPADPNVLVVKVAINRSWGTVFKPAVTPAWSYSSFLDASPLQVAGELFTDAEKSISSAAASLLHGGALIPGATELHFGFTEEAVRASGLTFLPIVVAEKPDATQLLVSMIMTQLGNTSTSKDVAYVTGVLGATHCASSLSEASSNWSKAAGAMVACLSSAEETIVQGLARYMAGSKNQKYAGKTEKQLGGEAVKFTRALKLLAAAGAVFQVGTYFGDSALNDAVRTLSIGLTTIKRPELVLGEGGTFNDMTVFTDSEQALATLTASLGPPETDTGWSTQACGPRSVTVRDLSWGILRVSFLEGSPLSGMGDPATFRYLASWYYGGDETEVDALKLKTSTGVGLGTPMDSAVAAYPDGQVLDDSPYSIYGGPVLEIFRGDFSNIDFEFGSSTNKVIAIASGGAGCE